MTGVTQFTTTGSNPGFLIGDGATSIASAGAGNFWKVTSIDFGIFLVGVQSWAAGQVDARIKFYDSYNDTGTDPVFGNLVGTVDYNLGALVSTSNAAFGITGSTLATPIALPSSLTTLGFTVSFFDNTTGGRISTIRSAMTTTIVPTVGTSSNGFYRDANDNGVIESTEKFVFNSANPSDNVIIRFNGTATPVPEPASMAALGLGAMALIRRRRNKA